MSSWTVARAESFVLRIPRAEPVRSSYATYDAFYAVVVQLHTDDGAVGTGYTNVIGGGAHAIRSFTASEYLPLVVGHEPHEVWALWQQMWLTGMSRGRKGVAIYALSAVDIALWDPPRPAGRAAPPQAPGRQHRPRPGLRRWVLCTA